MRTICLLRSYKGLKRFFPMMMWFCEKGLLRSYKGLKQNGEIKGIGGMQARLLRSYKGLKLFFTYGNPSFVLVFITFL